MKALKVFAFVSAVVLAAYLGSVTPSDAGPQYIEALNNTISAAE